MARVKLLQDGELAEGQARRVDAEGRSILLARVDNRYCAIDAVCSHRGSSLEDGEIVDGQIICPQHHAVFNLATGKVSTETPWARDQQCFGVVVEHGEVFVEVGERSEQVTGAKGASKAADPREFAKIKYNMLDPEVHENPYPVYAQARHEAPIFFVPEHNLWVISRYDDIWAVLKDTRRFSSVASTYVEHKSDPEEDKILAEGWQQRRTLVDADPPGHTRYRSLVNKAFTPRLVAKMEPGITEIANELIDGFVNDGRGDLVRRFAYPLPMTVIAGALGVPREDMETFKRWSDSEVARLSPHLSREERHSTARNHVEFQEYFAQRLEERRDNPRDDMLSHLVNARIEGVEPLDMSELLSIVGQLLVAGNETTTNLIGSMMWLLLRSTEQLEAVRGDPSLALNTVEEALRMESPVQGLFRTTTEEAEVGGVTLPKGAHVQLLYASGNRDDHEFPGAERFDVSRNNASTHLAFGGGIHYCIGAPLARMEAKVGVQTLLKRLPGIRLAQDQHLGHVPHFFLRGFEHLYIEWDSPRN